MLILLFFSHQDSEDGKTSFVKIHAPWEVLATYADVLKIKVPFKVNDIPDNKDIPMNWLSTPFRLPDHIMHPEPDYFTAPFDKSKSDFFLIGDQETFFPPSTRNRIVRMSWLPYLRLWPWHENFQSKVGRYGLVNAAIFVSLPRSTTSCPAALTWRMNVPIKTRRELNGYWTTAPTPPPSRCTMWASSAEPFFVSLNRPWPAQQKHPVLQIAAEGRISIPKPY